VSKRARSTLRAAVVTIVAALLLPGGAALAQSETTRSGKSSPQVGAQIFDAVVLRPFGFAVFVVGAVFFVPVALITVPNGRDSVDTAAEIFVTGPMHDVFQRPLGDF
jgi:hypothetical protein